jgi:hypothetical protein
MSGIRRHLTYANVMVTILAFLVLGGGTALASYIVSSNSQIGPGTVSGHNPPSGDHANVIGGSLNASDLASGAVTNGKLGTGAVTAPKLATGSVATAKLANGAVTAPKLAPSAIGARAYGQVNGTTVTRSKNVAAVTNPSAGKFCIKLPGSIAASQTGLVVTPEEGTASTSWSTNGQQAIAEWFAAAADCPAGQLEVITGFRAVSTSGSADGDVRTVTNTESNQGFFFIVP